MVELVRIYDCLLFWVIFGRGFFRELFLFLGGFVCVVYYSEFCFVIYLVFLMRRSIFGEGSWVVAGFSGERGSR